MTTLWSTRHTYVKRTVRRLIFIMYHLCNRIRITHCLRKGPRQLWYSPDLIKHCKTTLLLSLHEVRCQCWQEGAVLQDTGSHIGLYPIQEQGREERLYNNYRRISLLSIVGNVSARVIPIRLKKLAEHIYLES